MPTKLRELKKEFEDSAKLQWTAFFVCIFFIVCGSMLIHECQTTTSADTAQNVGLIVVGAIALGFTGILLVMTVYAARKSEHIIGWGFLTLMMLAIVFGAALGTLSIINGVDVPNNTSRTTIGWVIGGIATGIAVLGTLVCLVLLFKRYWGDEFKRLMVNKFHFTEEQVDTETTKTQAQINAEEYAEAQRESERIAKEQAAEEVRRRQGGAR